ncbi:unnamed protein product [Umbelopsis ramanniana]
MQDTTIQSTHGQSRANVSLQSLSLKSTKRRSYDPSLSCREQLYLGAPEQVPNQHKMRRSSSAQPLYPSMLSILEQEIQRPKSASRPLRTPSPSSSCDSDQVAGSLASIKSSTMNMFSTLQDALVRAEKAELQAKANQVKWRMTVSELDRLRDENLLVRNQFENSQAECHRLRDLLEQQSCQSTSSVTETPSISSDSSQKKSLLMDKLARRTRSISTKIMKKLLHVTVKF